MDNNFGKLESFVRTEQDSVMMGKKAINEWGKYMKEETEQAMTDEDIKANVEFITSQELNKSWNFQKEFRITRVKPDFSKVQQAKGRFIPEGVNEQDGLIGNGLKCVNLTLDIPLVSFLSMNAILQAVEAARDDEELRKKIPALQEAYEYYDTMKDLVGDIDPDDID